MVNYNGLAPGLYVQRGDSIKNLDVLNAIMGHDKNVPHTAEQLAAGVGWVFTALEVRREYITQVPYTWRLNDDDSDAMPFDMRFRRLTKQIDESLQLFSRAYLLKARGAGGKIEYIRWLDPLSIEPDFTTIKAPDGPQLYWKTLDTGERVPIKASDLLVFGEYGIYEVRTRVSPTDATTLAAQILHGLGQTADTFFDNNGLPVMLVKVGPGTGENEVIRLRDRFAAIFNGGRGTKEFRTIGVQSSVEVQQLSLAPRDLVMSELMADKVREIMAAHRVPESLVMGQEVNRAVSEESTRRIITTLGQRMQDIAEVFNTDRDFMLAGWSLEVNESDHWSLKGDERDAAQAFQSYVSGGMTPPAAAYLLGIKAEDFPSDLGPIFKEERTPEELGGPVDDEPSQQDGSGEPPQQNMGQDMDNQAKSLRMAPEAVHGDMAAEDLAKWRKKSIKALKRGDSPAQGFESEHIDLLTHAAISGALEAAKTEDDIRAAFTFGSESRYG